MPLNYKYKYYDTPEGQDIGMKTFACSKYAAATGLVFGTYDVLMYSHPQGLINTAGRYLYHTGPLIGMAAAFTVTTNAVQNIRGKNDNINYFLGGVVSGAIFGAWHKSMVVGFPAAIILGCAAMAKKASVDNKWQFFPALKQSTKTATSANNDWSILPDLPKTWK